MSARTGSSQPLFTPTLQTTGTLERPPGQRPWRISSQFYLAFYGGALPLAWIAYQNAGRLGLSRETQRKIAVAGIIMALTLVGLALSIALNRALVTEWLGGTTQIRNVVRLVSRGGGVVLFLLFAAWQKPGDRRYAAFGTGDYDSLWRPGLIATVVADVLLVAILVPALLAFA